MWGSQSITVASAHLLDTLVENEKEYLKGTTIKELQSEVNIILGKSSQ